MSEILDFSKFPLDSHIQAAIAEMGYVTPTPIQVQAIPVVLAGQDVMGAAQTGTGKTAGYGLPALQRILPKANTSMSPARHPVRVLILAPTRELAVQVNESLVKYASKTPLRVGVVYGGVDIKPQADMLRRGVEVLTATPGRLLDHHEGGSVNLSQVEIVILDEADRMLDMGFADDIKMIASKLPSTCQTIMFSATMPDKIEELAKTLLKNPVEVKIAVSKPAEKIKQSAYVCYETQKIGIIKDLFRKGDLNRVIVFSGKKQKVKAINRTLQQMKINSGEMHSDLEQAERDEILYKFKSGQIDVLVATDIVARGIDIDDIAMVINFDVPHDPEDYVHRIGRTARAQRDGIAITFVAEDEIYSFKQIEKFLGREVEKVALPDGLGEAPDYNAAPSKSKNGRARRGRGNNTKEGNAKTNGRGRGRGRSDKNNVPTTDTATVDTTVDNTQTTDAPNKTRKRKPRRKPENSDNTGNERTENKPKRSENANKKYENANKRSENASENGEKPKRNNQQRRRQQQRKPGEEHKPGNRQRTDRKEQQNNKPIASVPAVKQSSALTKILKKPLSWLKSLGKKK